MRFFPVATWSANIVQAQAPAQQTNSPDNLECLSRLGLWGPGTAFGTSAAFSQAMRNAGLPGLELLALNLKSEGMYLTRTLGFKVRRSKLNHITKQAGFL